MVIGSFLTGAFSFSAFAEGVAAVIGVYSMCKNGRKDREVHGCSSTDQENSGGDDE